MRPISLAVFIVFFVPTFSTLPALADTIHVPADQPTIQAGIDAAVDGDLVLVTPGTYIENIECVGKAITLQSESGVELTVIDGNQYGSTVTIDGGDEVQPVIDGFTIRNGTGTYDDVKGGEFGGGIYCLGSSPRISNCDIVENRAKNGGGIYTSNTVSATIADCRILGNIAEQNGAGVVFGNDRFISIVDCLVSENSASHDGGGIWCNAAPGTISNCRITGNSAGNDGAGITIASDSTPTIQNCIVDGNTGNGYGGGMYSLISPTIVLNCTFSNNQARYGGGIGYSRASNALVVNSILWANHGSIGHSEIYHYGSSYAEVSYSDVQGGWPGEGNIDADPLFIGGGDYHLFEGSPCVDAGDPDPSYSDACFPPSMGTERNDMGAYGGPDACDWGGGSFFLELDALYVWGFLNLNFALGTPEPAIWSASLILTFPTIMIIPLWIVPLPAIDPPIDIPIAFPLPSMGWITISSGLYADMDWQPEAYDISWVYTGDHAAGDMAHIPAGESVFVMGSDPGEGDYDEEPEHMAYLSAYEIDLYEVTNSEFADFINAYGSITSPEGYEMLDADDPDRHIFWDGTSWYAEAGYADHPVIEVSWYGAKTYCEYNGKRLPTEAEWEKAARGGCEVGGAPGACEDPADERSYPWGEGIDCEHANYSGCVGDTTPVGSYPAGVSPYGLYDMAGNVWEWVADWYDDYYYSVSPRSDPPGPESGTYRVFRGGSWSHFTGILRVANRGGGSPGYSGDDLGFRCAR